LPDTYQAVEKQFCVSGNAPLHKIADGIGTACRMFKKAVQQGRSEAHGVTNK
jgi:hypothetical protein